MARRFPREGPAKAYSCACVGGFVRRAAPRAALRRPNARTRHGGGLERVVGGLLSLMIGHARMRRRPRMRAQNKRTCERARAKHAAHAAGKPHELLYLPHRSTKAPGQPLRATPQRPESGIVAPLCRGARRCSLTHLC